MAVAGAALVGVGLLLAGSVVFYIVRLMLGADPGSIRKRDGTDILTNDKLTERVVETVNAKFAQKYEIDPPFLDWQVHDPNFAESA